MKNNKGITLIALVVTIIVLLILAGVSIAMLTGDNGILSRGQEAAYKNDVGNAKDEIAMKIAEAITNWNAVKYGNSTETISESTIDAYITAQLSSTYESSLETNYDVAIVIQAPTTTGTGSEATTTPGSISITSNKNNSITTSTTWNPNGSFSAWN